MFPVKQKPPHKSLCGGLMFFYCCFITASEQ